jgi:hypothetical protein
MSYFEARKCFDENNRLISPVDNPINWNLSNRLSNLADAVEFDMKRIQLQLSQILQALQRSK